MSYHELEYLMGSLTNGWSIYPPLTYLPPEIWPYWGFIEGLLTIGFPSCHEDWGGNSLPKNTPKLQRQVDVFLFRHCFFVVWKVVGGAGWVGWCIFCSVKCQGGQLIDGIFWVNCPGGNLCEAKEKHTFKESIWHIPPKGNCKIFDSRVPISWFPGGYIE